jgi:hypothetical protein
LTDAVNKMSAWAVSHQQNVEPKESRGPYKRSRPSCSV